MSRAIRDVVRAVLEVVLAGLGLVLIAAGAVASLRARRRPPAKPRLLWGVRPIKTLTYLSSAMKEVGYESETAVVEMSRIVERSDFDHHPFRVGGSPIWSFIAGRFQAYWFFARALSRYDIFHFFFDGGLLAPTILSRWELPLLRRLGKRVVLMPYGSDSFVMDRIADVRWRHGLMIEYGLMGDRAGEIERRVRRGTRNADIVVGAIVHVACLPRWDVLPVTYYPLDTRVIQPAPPRTAGTIRIAHASNHRGIKGTDFLIEAVERMQGEGHDVELTLIERMPNQEALEAIAACDIYVDQLVFAYALAAMEGMAYGKVVVSALEDTPDYDLFRRWSYLGECPIVPATTDTIHATLVDLAARRAEWPEIGRASRAYAERRHSFAAAQELWQAIYRRIWDGEPVDLINLYHPLIGGSRMRALEERSAPVLEAEQ